MARKRPERRKRPADVPAIEAAFLRQVAEDAKQLAAEEAEHTAESDRLRADYKASREWEENKSHLESVITQRFADRLRAAGFPDPNNVGFVAADDPRLPALEAARADYHRDRESMRRVLCGPPAAQPKCRPALRRDHLFLEWYETAGAETYHSPATICKRWNSMPHAERELQTGMRGKVTYEVVKKALKKARDDATRPSSA